jgi:hypothetical protein
MNSEELEAQNNCGDREGGRWGEMKEDGETEKVRKHKDPEPVKHGIE